MSIRYQIWSLSKVQRLPSSLREKVTFYAPLIEQLDYHGVGQAAFTRQETSSAIFRDGVSHTIPSNQPRFEWNGEDALGMLIDPSAETLKFPAGAHVADGGLLIWFEDDVAKVSPWGAPNPFDDSHSWKGTTGAHIKDLARFKEDLTDAEINAAIGVLSDVAQTPFSSTRGFLLEIPLRLAPNTVELLATPDLSTLLVQAGGITLKRVVGTPGLMQYSISGKTITLGASLSATTLVRCLYRLSGSGSSPGFTIEDLAGTKDGSNKNFTISGTPVGGVVLIFRQGTALAKVGSAPGLMQYSISGANVELGTAPQAGDDVWAFWMDEGFGFTLEDLAGTKDGSNTVFTASGGVNDGVVLTFRQGVGLIRVGSAPALQQYTVSGTTHTLGTAPQAGDDLWSFYKSS